MNAWKEAEYGKALDAFHRVREHIERFDNFDEFFDMFFSHIGEDVDFAKLSKWLLMALFISEKFEHKDKIINDALEKMSSKEQVEFTLYLKAVGERKHTGEPKKEVKQSAFIKNMERRH